MSTQLLIYRSAVPLTHGRHGDWSVEVDANYAFAAEINSAPLMAVEFPQAVHEYAIVFGGSDAEVAPAVILGVRGNENLFLGQDGSWKANYIPAFIRRYPFVLSQAGDRLVLCADDKFPGFNQEGRGQRLFGDDGKPASYVEHVLSFLRDYQAEFLSTKRFCARIKELGLLEPMQAQVTMDTGTPISLGGFLAVNRERLKALPAETFAELAKTDELELLYLHLHSLRNFDVLRERLAERLAEEAH